MSEGRHNGWTRLAPIDHGSHLSLRSMTPLGYIVVRTVQRTPEGMALAARMREGARRADGAEVCADCGRPYTEHPADVPPWAHLTFLCSGERVVLAGEGGAES